jgi:hypothetical protein
VAHQLLGTQCLVDIALFNNGPAHRWFLGRAAQEGLFPEDIVISAFSVAQTDAHFRANPPSTPRATQLAANLSQLVSQFALDEAIVGASKDVVVFWSQHLNLPTPIPYPSPKYPDDVAGFEEKLVIATAKAGNAGRGYILVDRKRDIHDQLGVLVHDPYGA